MRLPLRHRDAEAVGVRVCGAESRAEKVWVGVEVVVGGDGVTVLPVGPGAE